MLSRRKLDAHPGLIGLAGLLGGALLAVTTVIHNALAVEPGTLGGTLSGVAHAVAYAFLLLVLLGVHAENEAHYGRKGNIVVSILAIALGVLVVVFRSSRSCTASIGHSAGSSRDWHS